MNNNLLVADSANNIEVLNGATLQISGRIYIPNLAGALLATGGGAGFATSSTEKIFRVDPASLQVTGTAALPGNSANFLWSYSQPVFNGSTLYVPFVRSLNGTRWPILVRSTAPGGIAVIDAASMTLTAIWPFESLPLLALAPGGGVAYAVIPAAHQALDLDQIDPSTGQIVNHVQIPGLNTTNIYSNPVVSPDGGAIYFSNNDTLYRFDAKTLAPTGATSGIGLVNLALTPDGGYLYGAGPHNEQIVSTASFQVVGTIPSAYQPGPALFLP